MATAQKRSNGKSASASSSSKKSDRASSASGSAYDAGETYQAWGDFYQRMASEGMAMFQKNLDSVQQTFPNPMNQEMMTHWNQSLQEYMGRMHAQIAEEGFPLDPDAQRKLYNTWLETWSKNFETYMKTPEFAQSSGKSLEAFSEMKAKMAEAMEDYWHAIHLPSSKDMREIYHKLYIMERKLDAHERKLDQILEKLDALASGSSKPGKSKA